MSEVLGRRTFTGCLHLAPFGDGALYLTDAELSPWGLLVLVRHLDNRGLPVPGPEPGPHRMLSPLARVSLNVSEAGHGLRLVRSGTLGSLAEAVALYSFEADPAAGDEADFAVTVVGEEMSPVHFTVR